MTEVHESYFLVTPENINSIVLHALEAVAVAGSCADLKIIRSNHTGTTSHLALLSAQMGHVPSDQKVALGRLIGSAREKINNALNDREAVLYSSEKQARLQAEAIDITSLLPRFEAGARHPISVLQEDIADIFIAMGWQIIEGPELEHEWFNFDALNVDYDHPARQLQDTFFIDPPASNLLLRTQTSPVQIRTMLKGNLPIYMLSTGRVYRADEFDATHLPMFTQFEGLVIDEGINMGHLRGTLDHTARTFFGAQAKTRFRANFFPFTTPSAEFDLWHPSFIGGPCWIEWGGCGMVHPNVLRAVGIDSKKYSGFAFGMGIERTLMFRSEVSDMRDIIEGDVRFSKQFGMVT